MLSNYDVSIFIITEDNDVIHFEEYNSNLDGDPIFVMLTNDVLNSDYSEDNTIFIHKDWKYYAQKIVNEFGNRVDFDEMVLKYGAESAGVRWQIEDKDIPNTESFHMYKGEYFLLNDKDVVKKVIECHLNGYKQTQDIIMNCNELVKRYSLYNHQEYQKEAYIPAAMSAISQKEDLNNHTYYGFLPSIGQMAYISINLSYLNRVLSAIGSQTFLVMDNNRYGGVEGGLCGNWFSSSIVNQEMVWAICNGNAESAFKGLSYRVLPLFPVKI